MAEIREGDRFVNVGNKDMLIEVLPGGAKDGRVPVATVGEDGELTNRRAVAASSLRTSPIGKNRREYTSGWVLASARQARRLHGSEGKIADLMAYLPEETPDFGSMDSEELLLFIEQFAKVAKRYGDLADKAKAVMKDRQKEPGTIVAGSTAAVFRPTSRFSDALAKQNLSREDYQKICVTKADSNAAKAHLKKDSPEYKRCCEVKGWTMDVREATEEDRLNARKTPQRAAEQPDAGLHGFDLTDLDGFFESSGSGQFVS